MPPERQAQTSSVKFSVKSFLMTNSHSSTLSSQSSMHCSLSMSSLFSLSCLMISTQLSLLWWMLPFIMVLAVSISFILDRNVDSFCMFCSFTRVLFTHWALKTSLRFSDLLWVRMTDSLCRLSLSSRSSDSMVRSTEMNSSKRLVTWLNRQISISSRYRDTLSCASSSFFRDRLNRPKSRAGSQACSMKCWLGITLQHFSSRVMLTELLVAVRVAAPFRLLSLCMSFLGMLWRQSSNQLVSVIYPRRSILAPPVLVLRLSSFFTSDLLDRKKLTNRLRVLFMSSFFINDYKSLVSIPLFIKVRWMEVIDTDYDRKIEESFYEQRERLRKSSNINLPVKSHDHSLITRNKKFFNDSDQKQSPKFSPLNEADPKHERSDQRNLSLTTPLVGIVELAPRTTKQSEVRRFRSRYNLDINNSKVEFSPYKRPSSRRPRHSYLGNKENTPNLNLPEFTEGTGMSKSIIEIIDSRPSLPVERSSLNAERSLVNALEMENRQLKAREEVYKTEIKTLTDQLAKERGINAKHAESENQKQIKQLLGRIEKLQEQNLLIKQQLNSSKWQIKALKEKQKQFSKFQQNIRKQLKAGSEDIYVVMQHMLKKYRRTESLIDSIADMRAKITGAEKDTGMKELWRWLKKAMQEIHSINDWLSTLKSQLKLPRDAKFQDLKVKIVKRIFSA